MIALSIELASTCGVQSQVCATGTFFIGSCWTLATFAKDIKNDLYLLNIGGRSNRSKKTLMERFGRIVKNSADARQLRANYLQIHHTNL